MSARRVERALARLATPGAVLALERGGPGYGVYVGSDRRRRPALRLSASEVRALEADGAIARDDQGAFFATKAGAARASRNAANDGERFIAQHAPVIDRAVVDADGDVVRLRGFDPDPAMRRLAALRGASGAAWLDDAELRAAQRLRDDWAASQAGLVRGSDWSAPPMGSGSRGPGNAQEAAMARRCDARRRVAEALDKLAPPLRRVVERVCLHEDGLEALERAQGWPARSGKLALKLGLAQLAASF
jgi:hypothetical protein